MAAVEITISGVLYDKLARTQQNVLLVGNASLTDVSVNPPPEVEPPPVDPDAPHPAHPIVLPGDPGWEPPKPEEPNPPVDPGVLPIEWHAVWTEQKGWLVIGVPTGPHPTPSKKK